MISTGSASFIFRVGQISLRNCRDFYRRLSGAGCLRIAIKPFDTGRMKERQKGEQVIASWGNAESGGPALRYSSDCLLFLCRRSWTFTQLRSILVFPLKFFTFSVTNFDNINNSNVNNNSIAKSYFSCESVFPLSATDELSKNSLKIPLNITRACLPMKVFHMTLRKSDGIRCRSERSGILVARRVRRCSREIFFINLIIYRPSSFHEGFPAPSYTV